VRVDGYDDRIGNQWDYLIKRQTFDRKYVFTELDKLSASIVVPIQFFIVGGLALICHGLKEATKDIDVVVRRQDSCALMKSLASIDYHILEDCLVSRSYAQMEILKIMENNDGLKWDIFCRTVCNRLVFSDNMVSRAIKFYSTDKMTLSVASKEDIFLFKGITEREADLDDMRLLAKSGLDWQVIKTECGYQSSTSGRLWENALLQSLISLREKHKIRSPIEKELKKIAEEKLTEDFIVESITDGFTTIKSISRAKNLPSPFVRACARKMEERGLLKFDKTSRPYKFSLIKSEF
jgi:hypothetical protein